MRVKIHELYLADVRFKPFNNVELVALSANKKLLINWYDSQLVDPYEEEGIRKYFKKGSRLEWYQSPGCNITVPSKCYGITSYWIRDFDINAINTVFIIGE